MTDADILNAIDQGSFQYAKAQLVKNLKLYPNKSYFWALQSYYYYSTNDHQASINELDKLMEKIPSDTKTLDLLYSLCYKLNLVNKANEVYDNAIRKYPSTELITQWYEKNLAKNDWKHLTKPLNLLVKKNPDDSHYKFLNAFNYFLLSLKFDEDSKERTLYNMLSLKVFETIASMNNQQLYIKIKVLQNLKKQSQIIEELGAQQILDLDLRIIYLNTLNDLEEYTKLFDYSSKLIFEENFNDFDTWKFLIKSNFKLGHSRESLVEKITVNSRNSFLALIEIDSIYQKDLQTSIKNYYNNFKNKNCCYLDLKNYIHDYEFLAQLNFEPDDENLNLFKFNKLFKKPYNSKINDIDGKLIVLIESLNCNDTNSIITTIVKLEHLLLSDTTNYKIRIWLINLYSFANCSELAIYHYKNLKIKMIQHDTLGYKIISNLKPCKNNLQQLIDMFKFYLTSDEEIKQSVGTGFEKGIFNKLQDFVNFSFRLKNSVSRKVLVLEILRISRILNNDYYNYFIKIIKLERFHIIEDFPTVDNRDTTIDSKFSGLSLPSFPHDLKSPEYVKLNYLKELIIIETDSGLCNNFVKEYNRILSTNANEFSKFENWFFKILLNLFKIVKLNAKDKDDLINNLTKNLKFSKIMGNYLAPHTENFNNEFNTVTTNIIDLIRIYTKFNYQNDKLSKLFRELNGELSNYKPKFKSSVTFMNISELKEYGIEEEFIRDKADEIDDYYKQSRYLVK